MQFPYIAINRPSIWPPAAPVSSTGIGVALGFQADNIIAARFLEAVKVNPDEAWAFVSKLYAPGLDLNALREVLGAGYSLCKHVSKVTYASDPKNCLTRSVYVADPESDALHLLHLRMIKEPDKYGIWKICGVEQEECART